MRRSLTLLFAAMSIKTAAQAMRTPADHPAFTYSERFDFLIAAQARADCPGSAAYFHFTGNQLTLLMDGGSKNYFNVFIDGTLHTVLKLTGYGAEGQVGDAFNPSTQNINKSYASIIADTFQAECHVIAHSGLGLILNYGDPDKVSTQLAIATLYPSF